MLLSSQSNNQIINNTFNNAGGNGISADGAGYIIAIDDNNFLNIGDAMA